MAPARHRSLRRRIADLFVDRELEERTERLHADLGELGVDPFGYDPEVVKYAAIPVRWLYESYFRVETFGLERVPDGKVLLVANHSGQLPFDGLMIGSAFILERDPPRIVRAMVEKWVPKLPFVSVFMARVGQIVGTPDNCRRLLDAGDAILVFPEGARGISKTYDRRYRLERFGTGFMRLALEARCPIVPVAVIGAEEQAPAFYNSKTLAKAIGAPAFPVTPTFPLLGPLGLMPLPVKYRIYFGDPMTFDGAGDEEDEFILARVEKVRKAIESMLERGLAERPGVFF
jgi:1-acyl-sn-glycerol-3-phosphate acyltransferase